jgi:hypothetical protein
VTRKSFIRRRWFTLFIGVWTVVGCIREDEFECENAVAHLKECYPGFDASTISCTFYEGCGDTHDTSLNALESRCVQAKSCAEIATMPGAVLAQCHREAADGAPSSAGGTSIPCLSFLDCERGQTCCGVFGNGGPIATMCSMSPCAVKVCLASNECPKGETCRAYAFPAAAVSAATFCLPPDNTASDAAGDHAVSDARSRADVSAEADASANADALIGSVAPDALERLEVGNDADANIADVEGGADASGDVGGP